MSNGERLIFKNWFCFIGRSVTRQRPPAEMFVTFAKYCFSPNIKSFLFSEIFARCSNTVILLKLFIVIFIKNYFCKFRYNFVSFGKRNKAFMTIVFVFGSHI